MRSFNPNTILEAKTLAIRHEDKFHYVKHRRSCPCYNTPPDKPTAATNAPKVNKPTPPEVRQLTTEEMKRRRELELCFKCEERYHRNHVFKSLAPLLLLQDVQHEDSSDDDVETPPNHGSPARDTSEAPPVALHALVGDNEATSIHLQGSTKLQILVDFDATLNFIHPKWLQRLHLHLDTTKNFIVLVGNGDHMRYRGVCPNVTILIADTTLVVDLYVTPFHGADIVLGVDWLRLLGQVTFDYSEFIISFVHHGRLIVLCGDSPAALSIRSSNLHRDIHTNEVHESFILQISLADDATATPRIQSSAIEGLLRPFSVVFDPPTDLPPPRQSDHRIVVQPRLRPANVRPYRYPHFQKGEISHMISQMLKEGIIQLSQSPFSSLVLLVQKKDGT